MKRTFRHGHTHPLAAAVAACDTKRRIKKGERERERERERVLVGEKGKKQACGKYKNRKYLKKYDQGLNYFLGWGRFTSKNKASGSVLAMEQKTIKNKSLEAGVTLLNITKDVCVREGENVQQPLVRDGKW